MSAFVQLGLAQLSALSPDSPLLVSDDRAQESDEIKSIAEKYRAKYIVSRVRRGHFANDFQGLVNALAFAQATDCDVGIKVSQRFVFRKEESISAIRRAFEDPQIMVATPGQPSTNTNSRPSGGFSKFTTLSDIVCIRVGALTPDELIQMYRGRLIREKHIPWGSFIECAVDDLHHTKFPGRTAKIAELTNPTPDPIYLRRYQASPEQYRDLAIKHGFNGLFQTDEWNAIEGRGYMCKPVVI